MPQMKYDTCKARRERSKAVFMASMRSTAKRKETKRMKIIVLLELTDAEREAFKAAAGDNEIVFSNDKSEYVSSLESDFYTGADVILGLPRPDVLKDIPSLKWLQARSSGVDIYLADGVLPDGVILTSATGAYGQSVGEHVFAMMLGIMKRLPQYRDNQEARIWNDEGAVLSPCGARVLVAGTGDLGSSFAKLCRSVGSYTVGIRRDKTKPAEGIDEMHGFDEIDEEIRKADVICSMLPHSDDMVGFFNYERFMSMKKNAVFLNAGRGKIVDCDGLCRALSEGQLFGAGLDTLPEEPFPADHPLWKQKRAFITPHVAGGDHMSSTNRIVNEIALNNLKAYLAGEPLRNRIR